MVYNHITNYSITTPQKHNKIQLVMLWSFPPPHTPRETMALSALRWMRCPCPTESQEKSGNMKTGEGAMTWSSWEKRTVHWFEKRENGACYHGSLHLFFLFSALLPPVTTPILPDLNVSSWLSSPTVSLEIISVCMKYFLI